MHDVHLIELLMILLSWGLKQSEVAAGLGFDDSAITRILKEEPTAALRGDDRVEPYLNDVRLLETAVTGTDSDNLLPDYKGANGALLIGAIGRALMSTGLAAQQRFQYQVYLAKALFERGTEFSADADHPCVVASDLDEAEAHYMDAKLTLKAVPFDRLNLPWDVVEMGIELNLCAIEFLRVAAAQQLDNEVHHRYMSLLKQALRRYRSPRRDDKQFNLDHVPANHVDRALRAIVVYSVQAICELSLMAGRENRVRMVLKLSKAMFGSSMEQKHLKLVISHMCYPRNRSAFNAICGLPAPMGPAGTSHKSQQRPSPGRRPPPDAEHASH